MGGRRAVESKTAAMESTGPIEVVAIGKDSAVGYVGVAVEKNAVVVPIISPMSPSPAKTAKEANSKAKTKRDSRTGKKQSRIRIPAGPDPDRFSINEPRIILRHVNKLRVRGLDHNGLPLLVYFFLRCAL